MEPTQPQPKLSLGDFARKHKDLFWSTNAYDTLDERAVVEAVLNYGQWEDVQELFSIIGIKRAAEVFREWTSPKLWRTNYFPKITHYFRLYFDHYA